MVKRVLVIAGLLMASAARAAEDYPDIDIGGLLDLRLARTDATAGGLDYGLGKTRYGGSGDDARTLAHVGEAALLLTSHLSWSTSGRLYLKYDDDQHQTLDLVEGALAWRPVTTQAVGVSARAGVFFPPVSLENTGPAWTSPYSITPSAINTWIGEEVHTLGTEGTVHWQGEDQRVSASAAVYKGNDPAGSLIAWRGWALHDFKSGLHERVPLAPTEVFDHFRRQAHWVEPFHEIDGRWGYYGALNWERPDVFRLRALYYDNNGNPDGFNGTQWSWDTRFTSLGAQTVLPADVDLIAQYLRGSTFMRGRFAVVDTDFSSWFLLLSKRIDRHRVTLRYDLFDVTDNEDYDYNDAGHAWTLAYACEVRDRQRLMLELLDVHSRHDQREYLGLPVNADERLLQASYRIFF